MQNICLALFRDDDARCCKHIFHPLSFGLWTDERKSHSAELKMCWVGLSERNTPRQPDEPDL